MPTVMRIGGYRVVIYLKTTDLPMFMYWARMDLPYSPSIVTGGRWNSGKAKV
ncbi:hypothetical protein GGR23_002909 [Gellertiella hungarica]|uniref:Uncharacterized protein n=1 Tax=Gellertiella hungarica TaxID=1572859 RepID=A0A7W6J843_9HYPH|nr:hypothetical protein [Gellertiella hungarica]